MSYIAAILTAEAADKLQNMDLSSLNSNREGWEVQCHHFTLAFDGATELEARRTLIGRTIEIRIDAIGELTDRVIAARVVHSWTSDTYEPVKSTNTLPHVTMFVNRDKGAKPKDSNKIRTWHQLPIEQSLMAKVELCA